MTIFFIQKSFENIEIWAKQLQQYGPQNMKCALIGNKVDLEDFRAVTKEVYFSLNIFYWHTSCKWDWTQVMTTLVKSFPFYKDINKK
jgi:GTPase SAR1 family protein